MDSGVARKPIKNFKQYVQELETFQSESRAFVRDVINRVNVYNSRSKKPLIFLPEGENKKVLSALNTVIQEKILEPVLIGRKDKIQKIISESHFIHLKNVKIIFPKEDSSFSEFVKEFYNIKKEKGMSLQQLKS